MPKNSTMWVPKLKKGSGPLYLAIANAIAEDVATGQLQAEQRLPPQRKLAEALDLDFTTVARA
ncbi:GntR family transcriptional regulator, partial [Herbaspirillum sp.]